MNSNVQLQWQNSASCKHILCARRFRLHHLMGQCVEGKPMGRAKHTQNPNAANKKAAAIAIAQVGGSSTSRVEKDSNP
jgi:hypothetical protein